jgi:hypothetical protein
VTIEESARLVTGWEWAEMRLYEVLGAWAATVAGPPALASSLKLYFEACSQHHAWRAQLWAERRTGLPAHLAPNFDRHGPGIDELAALADDVGRLADYCRVVLPRAISAYRSWQDSCSSPSDRAVARALGFALADVMADWERGSALLVAYLSGEAGVEAADIAAGASRHLDQVLAGHGLFPDGRPEPR